MQFGLKKAISLANSSLQNVSGYKKFATAGGYKKKSVKTEEDFFALPISDKNSYIHKFKPAEIFNNGWLPEMAYGSSGSSGTPTYWFRSQAQEAQGGAIHERIFREAFGIKKQDSTLAVICFSMGIWVAGNFTLSCCRWVSRQGYKLASITPGIEKRDILSILKTLAPQFKNVILAGYPPFVMDILVECRENSVTLPKNLKIITAGDSFTESWRNSVCKMLGPKTQAESIVSIYGSADAGVIGFETPLSIFIKNVAAADKSFYKKLFGSAEKEPALVQFDTNYIFIESVNNELVFTSQTASPLIRYNIHDTGKILTYQDMKRLLAKFGLLEECKKRGHLNWQLPFVIKTGRTDIAVTFYALNIYPEHILAGLSDHRVNEFVSGNFRAYNQTVKNHTEEQLCLEVELAEKNRPSRQMLNKISGSIVESLLKLNTEFRKLHASIGQKAIPRIKLFKSLSVPVPLGIKVLVGSKNKKSKVVA